MPELPPEDKQRNEEPENDNKAPGMHQEFALRHAKSFPIEDDMLQRAVEAAERSIEDPDNPANKPLMEADKLNQLAKAFDALAAGQKITPESRITAVKFDDQAKQLEAVEDPAADPLPPIPLLETLAKQESLEAPTREESYASVRLVFALTSRALSELDAEKEHLSDKALSAIQLSLQAIRENTIHYPLASMAAGLTKYQIAGLLNGINMTITSDPVKSAVWRGTNPLDKALKMLEPDS